MSQPRNTVLVKTYTPRVSCLRDNTRTHWKVGFRPCFSKSQCVFCSRAEVPRLTRTVLLLSLTHTPPRPDG